MVQQAQHCRIRSLGEWNARWSRPWAGRLLVTVTLVLSTSFFIAHTSLRHSLTAPPGVGGDSPIYDSIGWQLSRGEGFSIDFEAPQFRAPYEAAETAGALPRQSGPVVDRPPLYPLLLAATDRVFGRQFWAVRILQALLMGSAAAIAAKLAFETAGLVPGVLAGALFTVVDWRTRWSVREVLTESLACWLVSLLALVLILALQRRSTGRILLAGIIMGLLILCRTMAVIWLPVIALGIVLSTPSGERRRGAAAAAAFFAAAMVVCLPWFVRNIRLLGEFRPLGTQGAEQLSAAYSDQAFRNFGMWYNLDETGFFSDVREENDVARALARAKLSTRAAREWVIEHPFRALLLWPMRVVQEFRPHGPAELFVLAFALLGLGLVCHRLEGRIGWQLLLAQVLTVAATWSVAGRFVIPLLGILHFGAGVGLWASYAALIERRRETRKWLIAPTPTEPS